MNKDNQKANTQNYKILPSDGNKIKNDVLELKIPVPSTNFYIYGIYNVSSNATPTILLVISNVLGTSQGGQNSYTQLQRNIPLRDFGFNLNPGDSLQVLIYNDLPLSFDVARSLDKLKQEVQTRNSRTHQDLCNGLFRLKSIEKEGILIPQEGCGGVLIVS